jgi:diacylglycerol kinase family enzyme
MKLFFVVNPISGGIDKEPFLKGARELCEVYGHEYRMFKTTGTDDEINAREQIRAFQPDKVVSVGGDGTALFTAITLMDSGYPMGIIPLGSANGMATELAVDPEPMNALRDIIMTDMAKGLDLLLINGQHYSIHLGDVGINAQIVESYEKDENRGMTTYAKYFLSELQNLKPFQVKVETAEEQFTGQTLMIALCNARKYGSGVPLNLTGNPMDGKFEIVLVEKIDLASLIRAGLASLNDKFLDSQVSKVMTTTKARIEFDQPRLLQLDGEVIEAFQTIDIELLKGAISLLTTKRNPYLVD